MTTLAVTDGWNGATLLVLGALILVILLLVGLHRRMSVMERVVRHLAVNGDQTPAATGKPEPHDVSHDRPYQRFLDEKPDRKLLPKSELFTEYRKWRKQKGLNWGKH